MPKNTKKVSKNNKPATILVVEPTKLEDKTEDADDWIPAVSKSSKKNKAAKLSISETVVEPVLSAAPVVKEVSLPIPVVAAVPVVVANTTAEPAKAKKTKAAKNPAAPSAPVAPVAAPTAAPTPAPVKVDKKQIVAVQAQLSKEVRSSPAAIAAAIIDSINSESPRASKKPAPQTISKDVSSVKLPANVRILNSTSAQQMRETNLSQSMILIDKADTLLSMPKNKNATRSDSNQSSSESLQDVVDVEGVEGWAISNKKVKKTVRRES